MRTIAFVLGASALVAVPARAQDPLVELAPRVERLAPSDQTLARATLGPLVWRGGLALSDDDARFGGLSGLEVSADGSRILLVTDQGHWVTALLRYDGSGHLADLPAAVLGPLLDRDGAPLDGKTDQDAEDLTVLPDGSLAVAFERRHRVWRYPAGPLPFARPAVALPVARGFESLRSNSGIEALAALADGTLLAIAEGREEKRESPAFLLREGRWRNLRYLRPEGFRPSGATRLPDGDLLVLERRYTPALGVTLRLVRVAAAAIEPGARLEGTLIATLRPPLPVDNFEGIAARRGDAGETLIYLVSDDNFSALQQTLLLLFALPAG